jgi:signal transduction histidine kinase
MVCRSRRAGSYAEPLPNLARKVLNQTPVGLEQEMNAPSCALAADMRQPCPEADGAPAVPAKHALDAQLHDQRLRLVSIYSVGLALVAGVWCAAYLSYGLHGSAAPGLALMVVLHVAGLGASGILGVLLCRRERLRAATYALVVPLILMASVNLTVIANAEGAGVITYCVAVGIAALALEGRELLRLAALIVGCGLVGALLHGNPIGGQVVLPAALASATLVVACTLGLAYPTGLFWLFGTNLTASRAEAWELARRAGEANRLMAERSKELQQRTEQLEAKNGEISDFLYVVSHDLRAPLINLEGFSRSLQDSLRTLEELMQPSLSNGGGGTHASVRDAWPGLKSEVGESLDFILRSVTKMDGLVRGLLELSRIDRRPQAAEPVDLRATVDEVLGTQQYRIGERGIEVAVDPLPTVHGDPMRLGQVFANLIDNAIKYMKPEGEARIHVGCSNGGNAYRFFVRDSGIGIHANDHGRVFRLFTRVANDGGTAGEGLGLTAVKKIVEKHGGRVWVESALGEGSTFWFTLPKEMDGRTVDDAPTGTDQDLAGRG